MSSVRNFLIRHVKEGYKTAVREAKRDGKAATMYIAGADYVKTVLGIEGEYTAGEDHNRSKYVIMDYEYKVTVEKTLENGEVTYEEETTNYLLRSLKRDNRCSLTLEYGQLSDTIAEVAA
ncbi:Uncharacterized protein Rs2_10079 [Raphanus sativus]|nr:Uncharacterized protein Rs2_49121 [Raphanus sativus]KAJ4870959.1 Uncharacterized protein Rs2_47424 [Raphanus sativus]KAJ4906421.1 Uncharacterized protein Rs2_10079 [Raphanus sativus]